MDPTPAVDPIQALEDQYFSNRNMLEDFNGTPDQLASLQKLTATSRSSYLTAVKNSLSAGDAETDALTAQLAAAQAKIQADADHLEDVSTVMNDITKAVTIGASMVAKFTALAAAVV